MTDCVFCKIVSGQIPSRKVWEDAHCYAFDDINPQAPCHVLIVPRTHIADVNSMTTGQEALFGHLFATAKEVARTKGIGEDGYRLVVNNGAEAGQTVFHVHMHVLGGRHLAWPPG